MISTHFFFLIIVTFLNKIGFSYLILLQDFGLLVLNPEGISYLKKRRKKVTVMKLKYFFNECIRVLKITRKPTGEEFKAIVKVSGVGILAIGAIGFLVQMAATFLF